MRIYLASSWRNIRYEEVRVALIEAGHDVYDFRDIKASFRWSDIDTDWEQWDMDQFIKGLKHPIAASGFSRDFMAMLKADACVLLLPCGRSAHLEGGWFVGNGKPLFILLENGEPELMYAMATGLVKTLTKLIEIVNAW